MKRRNALLSLIAFSFSACADDSNQRGFVRATALQQAITEATFEQITSVLVADNGTLISEQYFGDGGPDYLNDTRSTTKSLTAMTVGAAVMDGHLDGIDVPIVSFFDDERPFRFESELKDRITIRDLLTMSSALDCNDDDYDTPGNEEYMYPARRWTWFVLDLPTKNDYVRNERGYGPFSYCTAGSFLLGQIVERATGEAVDEYVARRLLQPLDIEQVNWDRSPSDEVMTGGGTELTSRALLKLGEMVRNRGQHNAGQILTAAWVDEMRAVHVTANDVQDYGYQWWRQDFACGDGAVSGWYMSGNGGNKVAIFDTLNLTVVVTAQLYGTRGMHQQSQDIIEDYVLADHPQCRD